MKNPLESIKKTVLRVGLIASLFGTNLESVTANEYSELLNNHSKTIEKNQKIQESFHLESGHSKQGKIEKDNGGSVVYTLSSEKNTIINTVVLENQNSSILEKQSIQKTIYQDGYDEMITRNTIVNHKPDGVPESVHITFPSGEILIITNHHATEYEKDSVLDADGTMRPITDFTGKDLSTSAHIGYEFKYPTAHIKNKLVTDLEQQLKNDPNLIRTMFVAQTQQYSKLLQEIQQSMVK